MAVMQEIIAMLLSPESELRQIIGVTLRMSLFSTIIALLIGVPLGTIIALSSFPGKRLLLRLVHTLMGLPPVVAGLVIFMLLSRSGPLGELQLLFSITAMVLAQVLIITPIVIGQTVAIVDTRLPLVKETAWGIGLSRSRQLLFMLYECRLQLFSVVFIGFGRAISEVGAAQIVGGNIQWHTRVMTTAIVLETNRGNFNLAIGLGVVLLIIAFIVTSLTQFLQEGGQRR